jgi:hypothetical protein
MLRQSKVEIATVEAYSTVAARRQSGISLMPTDNPSTANWREDSELVPPLNVLTAPIGLTVKLWDERGLFARAAHFSAWDDGALFSLEIRIDGKRRPELATPERLTADTDFYGHVQPKPIDGCTLTVAYVNEDDTVIVPELRYLGGQVSPGSVTAEWAVRPLPNAGANVQLLIEWPNAEITSCCASFAGQPLIEARSRATTLDG